MTMVLAIDTTGSRPAIVVLEDNSVLASWQGAAPKTPLLHGISDLLHQLDVPRAALRGHVGVVAVATGPGRYARLRAGVAFAKGMAVGLSAQLVGVPSAAAISQASCQAGDVVIPAGRDRFYLFNAERAERTPLSAPELVCHVLPDKPLVGDVDEAAAENLREAGVDVARIQPVDVAAAVGHLAVGQTCPPLDSLIGDTQPIYLTGPLHE
jgi:tRNA A37 threonylcarbamoyladenosine modification protein TsaB